MLETGRKITTGEYSGISSFKHIYKNFNLKFKDEDEARQILELVRYANVHKQKPLVQEEFIFIAQYPKIAQQLLTMTPPEITIFKTRYESPKERAKEKNPLNDKSQVITKN